MIRLSPDGRARDLPRRRTRSGRCSRTSPWTSAACSTWTTTAKTENTRAAYTLEQIPNALPDEARRPPAHVVLLTADAFGVLPPLARLAPDQAMFYFLAGYTAKVAGTEIGVTEPQPTFSTCFGAPFLPQQPTVYARMLGEKIDEHGATRLARQHRLDRRARTARASACRSRPPAALLKAALSGELDERRVPHRRGLRLPGAGAGAGRRAEAARPALDLARPRGVRRRGRDLARKFARELRRRSSPPRPTRRCSPAAAAALVIPAATNLECGR